MAFVPVPSRQRLVGWRGWAAAGGSARCTPTTTTAGAASSLAVASGLEAPPLHLATLLDGTLQEEAAEVSSGQGPQGRSGSRVVEELTNHLSVRRRCRPR